MIELILPHQDPMRFAKYVISRDGDEALVRNEFFCIPTLGMYIEAAAQSGAALANEDEKGKVGYLTTLKNVKLLSKPSSTKCNIKVILTHRINNICYLSFEVFQDNNLMANGTFIIVVN